MIFNKTNIDNCFKIIPKKNSDIRGSFHRSFCKKKIKRKKNQI